MAKMRSIANFVIHNLKLGGRSYDPKALEKFTPEEQAKLIKEYKDSLGLDASSLPTPELFDLLLKTRFKELRDFSQVSAIKGALDSKEEDVIHSLAEVDSEIKEALEPKGELDRITEIKKEMANIAAEISANVGSKYHPRAMVDTLHKLQAEAVEAVRKQQEEEKKILTEKFDDHAFQSKLNTAFKFSDTQRDIFKKDLLGALEESHKKQIEEFEKAIKEPVTKMHAAVARENRRVSYLATLYKHNEAMKQVIDELHNEKSHDKTVGVTIGPDGDRISAKLKDIDIYDIPTLETVTGRKVHVDKDNKTFHIEFPRRAWALLSPLNREGKKYYNSADDLMAQDILSVVGAVRATGANSINLNAEHPNQETALEIARKGFEQSRYVGFDEKKIKVTVNGKVMTVDELFKDAPQLKQNIDAQAATAAKERAEIRARSEPKKEKTVTEFRQNVSDGRQKADAEAKAEAEAEAKAKVAAEAAAAGTTGPVVH